MFKRTRGERYLKAPLNVLCPSPAAISSHSLSGTVFAIMLVGPERCNFRKSANSFALSSSVFILSFSKKNTQQTKQQKKQTNQTTANKETNRPASDAPIPLAFSAASDLPIGKATNLLFKGFFKGFQGFLRTFGDFPGISEDF